MIEMLRTYYTRLAEEIGRIDLLLIDGYVSERVVAANILAPQAVFTILHDTESPLYGWEQLDAIPDGHRRSRFRRTVPWTDVYSPADLVGLVERLAGGVA